MLSFSNGLDLSIAGADPVPTFSLKPDGQGGTDVEATSLKPLLDLSFDTYNNPNPVNEDGYSVFQSMSDGDFKAVAYTNNNAQDPRIIIAFRGTKNLGNAVTDISFLNESNFPYFERYVQDAARFVAQVENAAALQYSDPLITLTGHSLGGALAQLVGEASGFAAAAFDAPGGAQLYSQLANQLAPVDNLGYNLGYSGTNTNYRIAGDQVSLAGLPFGTNRTTGQTFTIESPFGTNLANTSFLTVVANLLNNHGVGNLVGGPPYQTAFVYDETPSAYTEGRTGPNYLSQSVIAAVIAVGLLHAHAQHRSRRIRGLRHRQ